MLVLGLARVLGRPCAALVWCSALGRLCLGLQLLACRCCASTCCLPAYRSCLLIITAHTLVWCSIVCVTCRTDRRAQQRITSCPDTCWMGLLVVSTAKQSMRSACCSAARLQRSPAPQPRTRFFRLRQLLELAACALGHRSAGAALPETLFSRCCSPVPCSAPVTDQNARQAQLQRGKCLSARFGGFVTVV